jgi:transglutaminase-like putative cysteine protease
MGSTGKTALLALLPAVLIASGWRRLEDPALGGEFLVAAALAVSVVLISRRRLRVLAEIGAFLVVVSIGFNLSPLDARPFDGDHDFIGPLVSNFGSGVVDFYEVAIPFDPAARPRMHGTIVLAVFVFTLLASLAIAGRRPVLAAATTFAGAAWPVALMPEDSPTTRGALLLIAALILLAALRPGAGRGSRQSVVVGSGVILAALVAVSSPSVAKGGFLDWQQWEPYTREKKPVSVQYVWDADYDGINFPKRPTTVLKIKAARRSPYWRATTLDVFLDDLWQEDAQYIFPISGSGLDTLLNDPLLPPAARDAESWLRQEVTVEALQDSHLAGASVPVAFEEGRAEAYGAGVAYVGRLERGQTYSVWSFAAQPRPAQLSRSPARYPAALVDQSPFLTVDSGISVPPFGTPRREAALRELFDGFEELGTYEPLYRQAREVVGAPPNPYAAAVALEAWFRTGGDFTYDETPPTRFGSPALVAFATEHRRGYCQHFAGAMALMLRYLGIPARVAAGFTTGLYDTDEGEWTVADTNAHTWVEVWFAGYGWLPFDPTPGRGRLRAPYSASSLFFDAPGATAAFGAAAAAALGLDVLRNRLGGNPASPDDRLRGVDEGFTGDTGGGTTSPTADEGRDLRMLGYVVLAAGGFLLALWVAKTARRRLRYLTTDPRETAGAVRAELADFLADQRVPVAVSSTPAEVSTGMWEAFRVDGERLALAIGEARYGPADEAEQAARSARRELRRVVRTLRKRLSAKRRLRGLLSLRSFGLRSA